ncbi:MAG: ComF family protein [bacterium]|nr:ComF family protein [bacterium]MBU1917921.1 ComF family protein [bacterium]
MLNLFFPKYCVCCHAIGDPLCSECRQKIHFIEKAFCPICGTPFLSGQSRPCGACTTKPPFYDRHFALFVFDSFSKKIIHDLKYHAGFWTKHVFQPLYREAYLELLNKELNNIDYIIPIPLHKTKLAKRGYNQSLFLAKTWQKILKKKLLVNTLMRCANTPSQTGLSRLERTKNLKGAFLTNGAVCFENKNVLLVDDVHTTGATLNEASKTLKKAGAHMVFASTLAISI